MVHKVSVFVGSIRKDSIKRKVANAVAELAPSSLHLEIIEIGHLPLYNQNGDANPPAEWIAFRERVRASDAVLFVTPEHNRSVPAALKNALDIGSPDCRIARPFITGSRGFAIKSVRSESPNDQRRIGPAGRAITKLASQPV